MTILQLCNKMPYPTHDGGAIATLSLTKSLSKAGCKMVVLAMNTEKHHFEVNELPENIKNIAQWHAVTVKTRFSMWDAAFALLKNESYQIRRFKHISFEHKLIELLTKHNPTWVQLEGLYLTPYIKTIRKYSSSKISLRTHNVEFMIWEGIACGTSSPLKKWYLKILAKQLKAFELEQINACDALLPITKEDELSFREMGCTVSQHYCPVGVNEELLHFKTFEKSLQSFFFIGSLDWLPNLEGLNWFLKEVWPLVNTHFPNIKFYIAGRNPPPSFRYSNIPNVEIVGEVDDAKKFMSKHGIMIVPLISGSGVRVKIIEGLALAKTIITTSVGVKGLEAANEKEILIANSADDFLKYITKCLQNATFCTNIGINGKMLVEKHYNGSAITEELMLFYNTFSL